jgi:hypothetical protein
MKIMSRTPANPSRSDSNIERRREERERAMQLPYQHFETHKDGSIYP